MCSSMIKSNVIIDGQELGDHQDGNQDTNLAKEIMTLKSWNQWKHMQRHDGPPEDQEMMMQRARLGARPPWS